jgi:four helix bundle protein
MQDFRNLKVWRTAHSMTLDAYDLTRGFPKEEMFGLTSQIRRACASIGANIAEGCGRKTDADTAKFFQIAMGSASEVQYHVLLAHDLKLMNHENYIRLNRQVLEVKRMLASLLVKVRASASSETPESIS